MVRSTGSIPIVPIDNTYVRRGRIVRLYLNTRLLAPKSEPLAYITQKKR